MSNKIQLVGLDSSLQYHAENSADCAVQKNKLNDRPTIIYNIYVIYPQLTKRSGAYNMNNNNIFV